MQANLGVIAINYSLLFHTGYSRARLMVESLRLINLIFPE